MAKKNEEPRRVRKLGEREEVIKHQLTSDQLEETKDAILCSLDDDERLEERKAEFVKNIGSQLKTNELQRNELRRQVKSGTREETVIVEEHLLTNNEVLRVRQDTGEEVGKRRTATPRELQEDLPFGQSDSAPQSAAAPAGDPFADAGDAFPSETH